VICQTKLLAEPCSFHGIHAKVVMSAVPTSTPFPVPSFNASSSNATPAQFLEFLRSLITQHLGDTSPRILSSAKAAWATIVDGLTDHFLGPFPLPDIITWESMQEKVEMTEATLEVIRRVFMRVEGIYNGSEALVRKMFARLLDLCSTLDVWVDVEILSGDQAFTPGCVKKKALGLLVFLLRGLGNNTPPPSDQQYQPLWKTLREILKECVDVCHGGPINKFLFVKLSSSIFTVDLTVPSISLTPSTTIALFRTPRILETKLQESLEIVGCCNISLFVTLNNVSQGAAGPFECNCYTSLPRSCLCCSTCRHHG
jgi:serine/threonine-protein kinase ATR